VKQASPGVFRLTAGYLGPPIKLTDAQTIELSAGTTYYTSIAGDGPALVLLRG